MRSIAELTKTILEARKLRDYSKPRKSHRHRGPNLTPENLLKAIKGSYGQRARIGKRLGVLPQTIGLALARPGYEECLEAYKEEKNRGVDESERTVHFLVRQRDDYKTALQAAKFVLINRGDSLGYANRSTVTLEGGKNPIQLQTTPALIPVESLPLELRQQMLSALDAAGNPPAHISTRVIRIRRVV